MDKRWEMMGKEKMQALTRAALADGKIHKPSDAWFSSICSEGRSDAGITKPGQR